VAAFVPGYVEDFEDLEDFEPEGVTHINPQKEAARREEELSELAEAGRRGKEQEEAELKAKEEAELKEKEEKELKSKEEAKRKLKERKEEEQRAREKEEAAPRRERHEHESDIRGKEDESQTVAETQCASEKPTLPAVSASSTRVREMEQLQVTIHGAKNLPKKGMLGQCNPYVVLIIEDQRIRSAAIRKSFNPGWNFTTVLDIEPDASQQLEICVFDETIDGDDLIGETCLGVDDIIMTLKVKEIKEAWLDMDYCNNAQIMISTEMVSKESTEESSCPKPMDKTTTTTTTTTKADEEASARQLEEEEKAKQKAREDAETARKANEAEEKAKLEAAQLKAKEEEEKRKKEKEEAQQKAKEEEEKKRAKA